MTLLPAHKASDFLDFPETELRSIYGFTAVDARKIRKALEKFRVATHPPSSRRVQSTGVLLPTCPISLLGRCGCACSVPLELTPHRGAQADLLSSQAESVSTCIAMYPFAALNKTHLNADAGERFTVINMAFEWWLCQNEQGDTGLLPSNHLEVLDPDAGHPAPPSESIYEMPTAVIRERIKEICDAALVGNAVHSLTYLRVKKVLIDEFNPDLFASEKEHVKEMIRRTEARLRVKHNSSTSHHARKAIAYAKKRRVRQHFKERATPVQKGRSRIIDTDDDQSETTPLLLQRDPSSCGSTPARSDSGDLDDADEEAEATSVRSAHSLEAVAAVPAPAPGLRLRSSRSGMALPPPPPPADPGSGGSAAGAAAAAVAEADPGPPWEMATRVVRAPTAPPPSLDPAEPRSPRWAGGWFRRVIRDKAAAGFGFALTAIGERRWYAPLEPTGLQIFGVDPSNPPPNPAGPDADAEPGLCGHVSIAASTVVAYPVERRRTVLIQEATSSKVHELVAETDAAFAGIQAYLAYRLRRRTAVPCGDHPRAGEGEGVALGEGVFAVTSKVEQRGRVVALKLCHPATTLDAVVARFERAAADLPVLRHPNVAQVLAIGVRGRPFRLEPFSTSLSLTAVLATEQVGPRSCLSSARAVCPSTRARAHRHTHTCLTFSLRPSSAFSPSPLRVRVTIRGSGP